MQQGVGRSHSLLNAVVQLGYLHFISIDDDAGDSHPLKSGMIKPESASYCHYRR